MASPSPFPTSLLDNEAVAAKLQRRRARSRSVFRSGSSASASGRSPSAPPAQPSGSDGRTRRPPTGRVSFAPFTLGDDDGGGTGGGNSNDNDDSDGPKRRLVPNVGWALKMAGVARYMPMVLAVVLCTWLVFSGWLWWVAKGLFIASGPLFSLLWSLSTMTARFISSLSSGASPTTGTASTRTTATTSSHSTPFSTAGAPPQMHLPLILRPGFIDRAPDCEAGQTCTVWHHPSVHTAYGLSLLDSFRGITSPFIDLTKLANDVDAHTILLNGTAAAAMAIEPELQDIWVGLVALAGPGAPHASPPPPRTASAATACSFGAIDSALTRQRLRASKVHDMTIRMGAQLGKAVAAANETRPSSSWSGKVSYEKEHPVRQLREALEGEAKERERRAREWADTTSNHDRGGGDDSAARARLFHDAGVDEAEAALAWWLSLQNMEDKIEEVQKNWKDVEGGMPGAAGLPSKDDGFLRARLREVGRLATCRYVEEEGEYRWVAVLDKGLMKAMDKVDEMLDSRVAELQTVLEAVFQGDGL